ncbi:MAG: hypothetical protein R3F10_04470 [Lysobacteraceae bacterium]
MTTDFLGNPVAQESAACQPAINDFIGGLLSYETRIASILPAADTHPEAILANTCAGILCMFLESNEAPALAKKYLHRAMAPGPAHSMRERAMVELLAAWVEDDIPRAEMLCGRLQQKFPRDLLAAKIAQYFQFNRGDFPAMLRVGLAAVEAAPEIAHAHGMLAFAFEQCHLLHEAERAARRALELEPKEPWAQHALAHVMLTQGRIDEGAAFMTEASGGWVGLNSFMATHNWWHLALFHLARGRDDLVLEIHDRHVWGIEPSCSQDQVGAVSLLARMEFSGIDVGHRWDQLAPWLEARANDVVQPFLSLQYLYGLLRGARPQANTLLEAIQCRANDAPEHVRATWREIAWPAAQAIAAHAQRDFAKAANQLAHVLPKLSAIGGSHAQRDLFAQIELDAVWRSGQLIAAQQAFELRRQLDPQDVPANRALARLYADLKLPALAQEAQARAECVR